MGLRLAGGIELARLAGIAGRPAVELLDPVALGRFVEDGWLEQRQGRLARPRPAGSASMRMLAALLADAVVREKRLSAGAARPGCRLRRAPSISGSEKAELGQDLAAVGAEAGRAAGNRPGRAGQLDRQAEVPVAGLLDRHAAVPGVGVGPDLGDVAHRARGHAGREQPLAERLAVPVGEQRRELRGQRRAVGEAIAVAAIARVVRQLRPRRARRTAARTPGRCRSRGTRRPCGSRTCRRG